MKIEVKRKAKPKHTIHQLKDGTVFSLVDFEMGKHCSNETYLKCKDYIVSLDNYDVIQLSKFWTWFTDPNYYKLDDDLQYEFEDSFLDRPVNIYDSTLTLCYD